MENRVETVEIARTALERRVTGMEEANIALEGRVKDVEVGARTSTLRGRGTEHPNEGYIPPKMLMPKTFSDKPEDWRAWKEDVLDWIDSVNPGVKDVLEEISKWEEWDEFDLVDLLKEKSDRVRNDKTQLWRALKRVTDGESRSVVRAEPPI
jgi:hypothetical protein